MYVHSVKLINFKPFGDYAENEVIIEPRITAIIGKNESGKSCVLDGLARINLIDRNDEAFDSTAVNRNSVTGTEISYHLVLNPTEEDISYGIESQTDICITKNSMQIKGGVLDYCQKTIFPKTNEFISYLEDDNPNPLQLRDQDFSTYNFYKGSFLNEDTVDFYTIQKAIRFFSNKKASIPAEKRDRYISLLQEINEKWGELFSRLPRFFYRNSEKHLRHLYKNEDIEKELETPNSAPNSMLSEFVKLIGISSEDFIAAVRSGTTPSQASLRKRISRNVNERINKPFMEFYHTESIALDVDFNSNSVSFTVRSNSGEDLLLSERSNGLRWYLETFIDAQAHGITGNNVVFLLDEPGVSLHVNAQKDLLTLFEHLADQGNQVVYTTHSPYMLNTDLEGLHRIRATVKNEDGFSYIYKSAYDARIAPDSQNDTLAPVISALGMNLNDTFGPAKDKTNIVTEGMSDYIYLSTMAKQLHLDTEKYVIIPSVGAANCVNICCILHGWGCKYIALFDFDKAGVESGGEIMRKDMMLEYGKQFCYVREVLQEEIEKKLYKTDRFMIEDVVTKEEIDRYCEASKTSRTLGKALLAKLICGAIEDGTFKLCQQSIDNFTSLFSRLL